MQDNTHILTEEQKSARARRRFINIWSVVGACVLAGVLVYLLNVLALPVAILLWTLVFVFCMRGTVNKLEARGIKRVWGTTIAYVILCGILALVGLIMFSPAFGVGDQFGDLVQSAPTYISNVSDWANQVYAKYSDVFQNETIRQYMTDAMESMGNAASDFARDSATGVVAVGTGVANTFVAIGFALVIAFWVLIELPGLGKETKRLAGPKYSETLNMLYVTVTRVMGGYIKGTLLQCAVIGVGCFILFFVLGIPNSAALGVITGVLNIIPIVGPWLGGALAALVGFFASPLTAFIALAGTIVIQQLVYTFVSPKIMQTAVDIHPALTLIALMAGSAIGGAMSGFMGSLVGMLASIPAVAVAKSVFVYYFEKRTGRRLVAEDGVFFKGESSATDAPDPMADATGPAPEIEKH